MTHHHAGHSLIDLLVATAAMGLVMAGLLAILRSGTTTYRWGAARVEAQQSARAFEGRIQKSGDEFVLQESATQTSYKLDDQDKAKQFEGKNVKIMATMDPTTNLVTFHPTLANTAAYPIPTISYLIVPTSGLSAAKSRALAAFITAVYVGIVVGVGTLVGSGGKPNLVLSIVATAIVAVAFQPVHERVQKLANRLVYGKKATPYEVLSQFSERVAESYAADEVLPRMARVLADGTGAIRTGVWLRTGDSVHEAASWPDAPSRIEPLDLVAGGLPEMPGTDGAVPVQHQGELLGALTFTKRPGEPLTPVEEKLLLDLASQAGLVLKNVGLTDELQRRLKDLRASRQRLVAAQDDERRRLERNLHDGAQQNLVALKVKLGLAEMLADKDVRKSRMLLSELQADADAALDTLRSLARGIYPPLLADRGLIAALESHARKATVPTQVEADGIGRYQQDIEAAVYFCCLEALQNVQKYALATRAVLKLADSDGLLDFEISDDGAGFDMASVKPGAGVMNMTDRLDALGGSFEMASSPGHGTWIHGSLPALAVVAAA